MGAHERPAVADVIGHPVEGVLAAALGAGDVLPGLTDIPGVVLEDKFYINHIFFLVLGVPVFKVGNFVWEVGNSESPSRGLFLNLLPIIYKKFLTYASFSATFFAQIVKIVHFPFFACPQSRMSKMYKMYFVFSFLRVHARVRAIARIYAHVLV